MLFKHVTSRVFFLFLLFRLILVLFDLFSKIDFYKKESWAWAINDDPNTTKYIMGFSKQAYPVYPFTHE